MDKKSRSFAVSAKEVTVKIDKPLARKNDNILFPSEKRLAEFLKIIKKSHNPQIISETKPSTKHSQDRFVRALFVLSEN